MSKLTHLRGIFSLVMSQRGMRSNFWLVARCLLILACCSFVFAYCFLLFARCSLLFTRKVLHIKLETLAIFMGTKDKIT